jgi:hypothetical protein
MRSRGGGGEAVATAWREWTSHRCMPQGIEPLSLLEFNPVNLGSRASYRHSGRGPLPTKHRGTPPIKALTGEAPGTRSPTEPRHWDQPNILPLDLNRSRLILKTQKKNLELSLIPFLNRSVYRAQNVITASYVLSDYFHFKTEIYTYFGPLVSKNYQLHHKTHVDCGSLNALGDKSLISRSANSCLHKTYYLILDILLSQHKLNLNHDVFGMNTRLVVIGVKYCLLILTVWLMWIFNAVFHS